MTLSSTRFGKPIVRRALAGLAVVATVLAVPILHERVGPARLAGAVLVVVGVAFLVY